MKANKRSSPCKCQHNPCIGSATSVYKCDKNINVIYVEGLKGALLLMEHLEKIKPKFSAIVIFGVFLPS